MLQPGDATIAANTMAKAFYDKVVAAVGAVTGTEDTNRRALAGAMAQAICEHVFAWQDGFVVAHGVSTTNITLSGTQTIDGVFFGANNVVLVAGQSTASQNGPYYVQSGAWTRIPMGIRSGMLIYVSEGTTYADTLWSLRTNDPITLGVSNLTFAQLNPKKSIWESRISGSVVITSTGTPTSPTTGWAEAFDRNGDVGAPASGVFTYSGAVAKTFKVTATALMQNGAASQVNMQVYRNGNPQAVAAADRVAAGSQNAQMSIAHYIDLSPSDTFELRFWASTPSGNMTIANVCFLLEEV